MQINEDHRASQLKARARPSSTGKKGSAGGKGSDSADATGRKSMKLAAGDLTQGEPNIGRVESQVSFACHLIMAAQLSSDCLQTNPLFYNNPTGTGAANDIASDEALNSIMQASSYGSGSVALNAVYHTLWVQFTDAPPRELWRVFQANFVQLHGQIRSLTDELVSAKVNRAKEVAAEDTLPSTVPNPHRKSVFAPSMSVATLDGTVGSPAVNPLIAGRRGGQGQGFSPAIRVTPTSALKLSAGAAGGPSSGAPTVLKLSAVNRRAPGMAARMALDDTDDAATEAKAAAEV
jgi:hypothetical protein